MIGCIIATILYLLVGALVMCLAWGLPNPYGRYTPRQDWLAAVMVGAVWPYWIVFVARWWFKF